MSKSSIELFVLLLAALVLTASSAMAGSYINSWNIYYGHLHNHTTVSDGSGSPDQAYSYAKNTAGLDFFSTADHAEDTTSTEYAMIKNAADAYNQDGVFTAFWGFEWSSGTHGHVTVTYADNYCTAYQSSTNTFSELITWLSSCECIAFFNHPGRESNAFEHYDGTVTDKFVGMELWNKNDDFYTYYYNDGFHSDDGNMGHYDEALLRGWKIGAGGAEDNHGTNWGTQTDFRMAILANNLTRTDLYNAMKARRIFSTLDKNLGLYLEMDGQPMGSEIEGGSNSVLIEANDADYENVVMVELLKNGGVINTWYPDSSHPYITDTVSSAAGDYFYCRISQSDGDEAVSSPIFITSGSPVITAPVVSNTSATNITSGSANLNGIVTDDGSETPEVIIYWGDNDGGTNPANWDNADSQGFISVGFSMNVNNLLEDTTYYYRSYAVNSAGEYWADSTESFTTLAPGSTITEEVRVGTSMADIEEGADGSIYTDSSDLEIVDDSGYNGDGQIIGMRFTGVDIPYGATIQTAYIQFKCDETNTVSTNLTIHAQDSGNAEAFSTSSYDVSSRATTSASASWSPAAWNTVGETGQNQRTPDLSAVIQEVVDRGDWYSGNAIVVIVTGSGTRTAEAYDGDSSGAALLHVEYSMGGSGNTAPTFIVDPITESDATEGVAYSGSIAGTATDADGDTLTYNKVSGPAWLSVAANGTLSGTPSSSDIGANNWTVQVSDGYGGTDTTVLNITVTEAIPGSTMTEEVRVGTSMADIEEGADGSIYTDSSDLEIVDDSGYNGDGQIIGMRFTGVDIPYGATIQTAYIQFKCDETNTVSTNLTIHAQDSGNAEAFSISSYDVSSRATTSASASWSPAAWNTVGETGQNQRTPDLSAVIQEVVDRGDWYSGNAIVVIVTGSGTRTAEAYDGDSSGAALLHVEYSMGGSGNTAPTFIVDPITESDATEGVAYSGSIAGTATDADGDTLTYNKVSGPAWLSVASNGTLSGTPSSSDIGANNWTVQVSDDNGGTDTGMLDITVTEAASDWAQIIYDDFEGGYGNWVDGGTDCKLYTRGTRAYQGSNAINLQDNTSTSVVSTNHLALSGYSRVKVDFSYYPYSMDRSNEDFWLQISTDGGSSYTTVEEWNLGDEFENGSFYSDSVTITGYTLTNQTRIRFRCDASGNRDDIYLDAIEVSAQ